MVELICTSSYVFPDYFISSILSVALVLLFIGYHRPLLAPFVGKTRCAYGKRVGFRWGVGIMRAGAPRYLHAIYTYSECMYVSMISGRREHQRDISKN